MFRRPARDEETLANEVSKRDRKDMSSDFIERRETGLIVTTTRRFPDAEKTSRDRCRGCRASPFRSHARQRSVLHTHDRERSRRHLARPLDALAGLVER